MDIDEKSIRRKQQQHNKYKNIDFGNLATPKTPHIPTATPFLILHS